MDSSLHFQYDWELLNTLYWSAVVALKFCSHILKSIYSAFQELPPSGRDKYKPTKQLLRVFPLLHKATGRGLLQAGAQQSPYSTGAGQICSLQIHPRKGGQPTNCNAGARRIQKFPLVRKEELAGDEEQLLTLPASCSPAAHFSSPCRHSLCTWTDPGCHFNSPGLLHIRLGSPTLPSRDDFLMRNKAFKIFSINKNYPEKQ